MATSEWLQAIVYKRMVTSGWLQPNDYKRVFTNEWLQASGSNRLITNDWLQGDGYRKVNIGPRALGTPRASGALREREREREQNSITTSAFKRMRSQISATTISHHWKNAQPPPRRALAGSSSSYARHCLQPPPGKQDTKQAKYPRTVGGRRFFYEVGTVLLSEALVKAPDVIFCTLFENEGPRDRFLDFNPVFKDFHAGQPAGRPARPAQPGLIR